MKKWFAAYGLIFYRYLDYRGRSPRSELWNFIINTLLIQLAIHVFAGKSIVSFTVSYTHLTLPTTSRV